MELKWYHMDFKRRIGKGNLPEFAKVYNDDGKIKTLTQSQASKIYRDIQNYDKNNNQSHLSSPIRRGGRKRRRTKRRGRRRTKRRGKSRRKSKKRRRTRRRRR